MNVLDLYLQKQNSNREMVVEKSGINKLLLSMQKNRKVKNYPESVIEALAKTLNKTSEKVKSELMEIELEKPAFEAYNPKELLLGIEERYDFIIIKGEYKEAIREVMKGQLSENERLGMELGSAGTVSIPAYLINSIRDLFSEGDALDKKIERKIGQYKLHKISEDEVVLKLIQLDY